MKIWPLNGRGLGHVTIFEILGPPLYLVEWPKIETSYLVHTLTMTCTSQCTTNWPLQWAWSGSRDLKLNVCVCVEVYVRMSPGQWRRGDVRRLSRRLHRTTLWALCWRLRRRPDKAWRHLYNPRSFVIPHTWLKDHRQRIPRFVIRRYLEKSIQKKLFLPFTIITNKDYFSRKNRL